jgi:hypothetical protein
MIICRILLGAMLSGTLCLSGCTRQGYEPQEPCKDVDCSGHGDCGVAGDGTAVCLCHPGYHAEGLGCVENVEENPCEGFLCSGHGDCAVDGSDPVCLCQRGYHVEGGTNCIQDADPCQGVDCSGHGTCAVTPPGEVICACDTGYHNDTPTTCVPDEW